MLLAATNTCTSYEADRPIVIQQFVNSVAPLSYIGGIILVPRLSRFVRGR